VKGENFPTEKGGTANKLHDFKDKEIWIQKDDLPEDFRSEELKLIKRSIE